jgi:hypothetical protein
MGTEITNSTIGVDSDGSGLEFCAESLLDFIRKGIVRLICSDNMCSRAFCGSKIKQVSL